MSIMNTEYLISILSRYAPDIECQYGFGRMVPDLSDPHNLVFEVALNTTVGAMLGHAVDAINATHDDKPTARGADCHIVSPDPGNRVTMEPMTLCTMALFLDTGVPGFSELYRGCQKEGEA